LHHLIIVFINLILLHYKQLLLLHLNSLQILYLRCKKFIWILSCLIIFIFYILLLVDLVLKRNRILWKLFLFVNIKMRTLKLLFISNFTLKNTIFFSKWIYLGIIFILTIDYTVFIIQYFIYIFSTFFYLKKIFRIRRRKLSCRLRIEMIFWVFYKFYAKICLIFW
jgi:hypothetical protein